MMYHKKLIENQEALDHAKDLVQEKVDEYEKENLENDSDDEAVLECQPVEADEAMKNFKDIEDNVKTDDLEEILSKLNQDKKRVFDTVTNVLKTNEINEILRLYVSGEGGTGKSFLIHAIRCWIKKKLNKSVAVAAPTGIAAYNINGLTIHRIFHLPVEHDE